MLGPDIWSFLVDLGKRITLSSEKEIWWQNKKQRSEPNVVHKGRVNSIALQIAVPNIPEHKNIPYPINPVIIIPEPLTAKRLT